MAENELKNFYEKRKASHSFELTLIRKKINTVSNIRLALAGLALAYFAFSAQYLFYTLPFVLLIFILLVRQHSRLFDRKIHLENLVRIQSHELSSLAGDYSHNSSGSEFINVHHPYTHDLDVFGEGSLFQYLYRSATREGKRLLADRLSRKPDSIETINMRQEAIRELAGKTEFRQEVQALSMRIDEQPDDSAQLRRWLTEPAFIYGKAGYRVMLTAFPLLTVSLVLLAFFVEGLSPFAILAAGIQWVFLGFHLKRVNHFHQYISRKKNTLAKYARILGCIGQQHFTSSLMQSIGARAGEGDGKVRKLAALVSAFDARLNSMTNLVVNSLLLYDLQCVYRLEKWKDENSSALMGWLDTIKETEVLSSFGTFAFNHPRFVFAEINSNRKLTANGMGHPLISEHERITNDVSLGEQASVMIITGANMAGKSTFLRSLGVNVVLALAGSPVCANKFECPLIEIRSGMRTADSLKDHQSYFYAELDRLKSIMFELQNGVPLLILLDEILKGTNSTDKQAGSIALVKQLVSQTCLVLVATHDLALGDLETLYPGRILNYSFEATIEDDQLSFDYKLKRGIAQNMNATFLMKKMGIVPDEE